jgi:hypothetical protein
MYIYYGIIIDYYLKTLLLKKIVVVDVVVGLFKNAYSRQWARMV